jgi:hypothetical protein
MALCCPIGILYGLGAILHYFASHHWKQAAYPASKGLFRSIFIGELLLKVVLKFQVDVRSAILKSTVH